MATYEYKCTNEKCSQKDLIKTIKMSMSEYSEEKLPKCEICNEKTSRNYTAFGHQTFGDGYKS